MEATKKFEDERRALEMVAKYTSQGDNNNNKVMIFQRDRGEIDEYLQTVDYIIQRFMHKASLETAETLRKQLVDEFGSILNHAFTPSNTLHPASFNVCYSVSANYSTSVSTTSSLSFGEITATLLADLHSIAQRLSAMGYLEDCKQLYKTKRLEFLDATLRRFGIQKLSAVEVKRMEWEALDKLVGLWLTAVAFCVDLIPIERQTHESIFKDNHGDAGLLMVIVRAYVSPFLDFTQAIASTHPSPHKLFRILDLHRILKISLRPCVLFDVPRDDPNLVTQVEQVLSQLKESAKVSFQNFERAVNNDVTHISSVQEGVHTTTNYVMDYMIRLICEYSDECEWIVSKPRKVEVSTRINGNICEKNTIDGSCGLSPFASHVIWVIAMLLRSLKIKTNQHRDDDAFANFFMMNNLNYIVQKVNEQPRLRQIIGGDFQGDLETDLRSRKLKYLRSSWIKIVQDLEQCSSPKKIKLFNVALSRQCTRKETLRNFNEMFDKVHQTQSRWSACDANLVQQLRKVILDRLIPTYEHFLDQLSESSSGNPTTEIQYSVEDVKKAISQLFQGRPPTSF